MAQLLLLCIFQGPVLGDNQVIGFNDICTLKAWGQNWTDVWDEEAQALYAFNGDRWITYENETSVLAKIDFLCQHGLAGVKLWSIDSDDWAGACGMGPNLMLETINHALATRPACQSKSDVVTILVIVSLTLTMTCAFFGILLCWGWGQMNPGNAYSIFW